MALVKSITPLQTNKFQAMVQRYTGAKGNALAIEHNPPGVRVDTHKGLCADSSVLVSVGYSNCKLITNLRVLTTSCGFQC